MHQLVDNLTKETCRELFGGDDWEFFVAFIDPDAQVIVHLVGYPTRPNVLHLSHLFYELKTDKEFAMASEYVDTLQVRIFQLPD